MTGTQEIVDRLNEIEQSSDEPGHNSMEIWDYIQRLEEYDESFTDIIDPSFSSTKIGLSSGAIISWDEQTKRWHELTVEVFVERLWDGHFIKIEKEWLERAKELVREAGLARASTFVRALEEEMGRPPFDNHVSKIIIIAEREVVQENKPMAQALVAAALAEQEEHVKRQSPCQNVTGTKHAFRPTGRPRWSLQDTATLFSACVVCGVTETNNDYKIRNTCNCRCMQGKNCGGCGHQGCGYTKDAQVSG